MKNNIVSYGLSCLAIINILSNASANTNDTSDTIFTLYNKREYLVTLADICTTTINNKIRDFTPKGNYLIREMENAGIQEWEKNKDSIYEAFLGLCDQKTASRGCDREVYNTIRDTILIKCLLKTLGMFPKDYDKYLIQCIEKIPYPYLNKYKDVFLQRIQKLGKDGVQRFYNLYALIPLPDTIRDEVIQNTQLKTGLKARQGDKNEEAEILKKVKQIKNYNNGALTKDLTEELSLCGTEECLKAELDLFTKPIYDIDADNYVKNEYRIYIIRELRKYHPDQKLLYEEYRNASIKFFRNMVSKVEKKDEYVKEYIEKFIEWVKNTYSIQLKMNDYLLFKNQKYVPKEK